MLTQTVWERMTIKYTWDTVAPAEFVHTVSSLFPCVCACVMPLPLPLHLSATHMQLSPECVHAHACVNLCVSVFVHVCAQPLVRQGVFGMKRWKIFFPLSSSIFSAVAASLVSASHSYRSDPSREQVRCHLQVSRRLSEEDLLPYTAAVNMYKIE